MNRRNVLKALGATGAAGLAGVSPVQSASKFSSREYGSTRMVDVGVAFNLHDPTRDLAPDESLTGFRFDGNRIYWTDSDTDVLVLKTPLPDSVLDTFDTHDALVSTASVAPPTVRVTSQTPVQFVPTSVDDHGYLEAGVTLANPIGLPSVVVQDRGDPMRIIVEGTHDTLEPGFKKTYELATRQLTINTERVTDEIPDVPPHEQRYVGPKIERDSIQVSATPIVTVTDHGHLQVVERRNYGDSTE